MYETIAVNILTVNTTWQHRKSGWVNLCTLPNLKTKKQSNKYKHYTTKIQVHTRLWFTLNRDHNSCAAHSHLFQLCKTCQTEIQQLNKVPLLTHHGRKQVFRLLLQKQTSDSRRWWNRADPKLFSRCSKPAKPAAAWSIPLTPPPERKQVGTKENIEKDCC